MQNNFYTHTHTQIFYLVQAKDLFFLYPFVYRKAIKIPLVSTLTVTCNQTYIHMHNIIHAYIYIHICTWDKRTHSRNIDTHVYLEKYAMYNQLYIQWQLKIILRSFQLIDYFFYKYHEVANRCKVNKKEKENKKFMLYDLYD